MERPCDSCGVVYVAKRPSSRFCSARCRQRAQRAPKTTPTPMPTRPDRPASSLVEVTERQLEDAGRLDTVIGQQALALAARIGSQTETGASIASLSKEFRAVMAEAMEGVAKPASQLDELRARRDRLRAAAG